MRRPGLAQLLEAVRSGRVEAILISKLDRLTRSVTDLGHILALLEKHDTAIVSLSENLDTATAAGRLMLNVLASVSQWEREAIGERTAFVLGHKRQAREVYGQSPFGFRREGNRLVEVPIEKWALLTATRMRNTGTSFRRIGEWLAAQGLSPRQGGREWQPKSVAQILGSRMAVELARGLDDQRAARDKDVRLE